MPFDSILGVAWPADGPGLAALITAAAALALVPLLAKRLANIPWWLWVALWAGVSVLGSVAYVHHYLHGGPRIIDATSYWLEARGFSHGLVSWPVDDPTASFRGRFLVHQVQPDGSLRMGVIFPPGYPALLALGFLFGIPMLVGPALAGGLTAATAVLAKTLTGREDVGRIAAVLSALNACLRYHTADTMSHGLAALLLTGAVIAAVRATVSTRRSWWVLCGALTGCLAATRPATALALFVVGAPVLIAWMVQSRRVTALWCLLGAAPPLVLFALHQHALTGAWLVSSQRLYYALADGPPGCFRYGFGPGIGCVVEHGPYVSSVAPHGYGLSAALATTGRRIYLHLADVLNYAPFAVLMVAGLVEGRRTRATAIAVAVPLALIAAYAPFYFDGCYPGGGARMLADGLPFEQVLIALGLAAWARRFRDHDRGSAWAVSMALSLSAAGFALHASHMHLMLRDRDAGRPLYEASLVRETLGDDPRGLLFVDTDHGFNLAHDPASRDASSSLVVARERYDARDWLLWDRLGRPTAWRYAERPWETPPQPPRIEPWRPRTSNVFTLETEAEWPALEQTGGYAAPTHLAPGSCVSAGRALGLTRTGDDEVCVKTELSLPSSGPHRLRAWLVATEVPRVRMWVDLGRERYDIPLPAEGLEAWPGREASPDGRSCLPMPEVRLGSNVKGRAIWVVCSKADWLGLDRVEIVADD
jgi:hypothetical protein